MPAATEIELRRARDREKKRVERSEKAVVFVPRCVDKSRRERLEQDDEAWLRHYFGPSCGLADPFWYDFTAQQREMIAAIRHAIKHGGDQAIAASRGEGKTTLTERLLLKCTLTGEVDYSVLFAASGSMADNCLDSIKTAIVDNVLLAEDYPEVCVPVSALEGAPQRANTQRVSGERHDNGKPYEMAETRFTWCGQELIFPSVPGSPSSGAIIATRGLDAAVRGLKKRGKRPKLAIIDDPDTEDTSRSEDQAKKLERRIDAAIGGLGGQQRSIGRVLLTTLQSRIAVSFRFTDPKQKPTFKGRRFRFLIQKPERMDLWEEYVRLRVDDMQIGDEFCRRAHAYYLDNREAMDAGAVVANPNRFDSTELPDGTQMEVSALQRYFNEVAKLGQEVVSTEYDNDPPEESAIVDSGLSPTRIQRQVNGYERRSIPPNCTLLTQGIDVRKTALHWVIRAWEPNGSGHTIDYGVHEVRGVAYGSDDGVDVAIRRAILERMEATRETEYVTAERGQRMAVDLSLVDAGWRTDAVYAACLEHGTGLMPVMGFGRSSGCTAANFHDVQRRSMDKKPGDGWFLSRKGKLWLVCADTDRWKAWEHDRWLTTPGRPGSLQVFGLDSGDDKLSNDQKSHHAYARHICNESEVEEPYRGTIRRAWKAKSDNTHWLDASYYANVAANIRGIRLSTTAAAVTESRGLRVDLSQRVPLNKMGRR